MTPTPTPELRAKLRDLHAKATQGEWNDCIGSVVINWPKTSDIKEVIGHFHGNSADSHADAKFTAAAHNALPGLLDALDAAEKEIAQLKADLKESRDLYEADHG